MWQFDAPCGPEHCHVETRMDNFCHQICFLQNQEGFRTMFWHNFPHLRFHREWSDCRHCGSEWPPTHHYRNDLISIDYGYTFRYIFLPGCSPYPHPPVTICKVELWLIGEKSAGPVVWYCQVKGSGTPSWWSELVLRTNTCFLYSNRAAGCLTMEPSLDSSFGNWMSKVCNKLLCDLGQWTKSDVFTSLPRLHHHRLQSSLDNH